LKEEYRSLGGRFQRKRLCTVRLSRKIFPGLPSYSLGNLTKWFGIKIENRHTATGDAEATVKLFEMLLDEDHNDFFEESLSRFSREGILPPNLPKETFESLPEETGVYYFHNEKGEVIYVGKARSIRDRIISHFTNSVDGGIKAKRNSHIYDITFELTGNELVALLFESREIKRLCPIYNRAQKRIYNNYGIYPYYDNNDYLRLGISKVKDIERVLVAFRSLMEARRFLERKIEQYGLCPKLCGLQKSTGPCFSYQIQECKGACTGEEENTVYNKRVQKVIDTFSIKEKSFCIDRQR